MYKQLLLPIDGSELAFEAACTGIELARSEGAKVIGLFVTHTYSPPFIYPNDLSFPYPTRVEFNTFVKQEANLCLQRVSDKAEEAGVEWQQVIRPEEDPSKAIIELARERQCDLIVMGSHGRSGVGQLVLGSVTAKVLAHCDTPVLVYRARKDQAKRNAGTTRRATRQKAPTKTPASSHV